MRISDYPAGTVIVNRVTGERGTSIVTSAMSGGEFVRAELVAVPGGHVAGEHFHPKQSERFEVVEGELTYTLDGVQGVARAGQSIDIPPGARHDWWNAGSEPARAILEVRPALHFEEMIAAIWGLAAQGKTDAKGKPGLLQLAVIADTYAGETVFTSPPPWVQRLAVRMLAPLGRALGHKAWDEAWAELIVESVPDRAVPA
jgi:quercetin dioxygenase-like cupin family protein